MKFILGQKKQMTQIFEDNGTVVPVTAVLVERNVITQLKNQDKDGYIAIQVGSGATKKSHKKQQLGHLKELKPSRWLKEFRFDLPSGSASHVASQSEDLNPDAARDDLPEPLKKFKRGMEFGVEIFRPGDKVQVTGVSKGKGFQGVVKRHGFHGQDKTHGNKDQLRMPGSIGATGPAHVFKGMRMPGRMGTDKITVAGLQVVKVDQEKNLLYIKGALPGAMNSLVMIQGPGTFKLPTKKLKDKKTEEQEVENSSPANATEDKQESPKSSAMGQAGIKNQAETTENIQPSPKATADEAESTENKKPEAEKENKEKK